MSKSEAVAPIRGPSVLGRNSSSNKQAIDSPASRQRNKIKQIGEALREAGFVTLDNQSRAFGLSRSTTWKVLQADYKTSGLQAELILRMLSSEGLPLAVRCMLREYVIERVRGLYGHKLLCRRRFAGQLWEVPELIVELHECKDELWLKIAEMEA